MATTNLLMFTSITVISHRVKKLEPALFFPTRESFKDWGEYFGIAIPVTIMLSGEWWAYEILNFSSGLLGVVQ
jgi:multidrug resistance protein, MATE family